MPIDLKLCTELNETQQTQKTYCSLIEKKEKLRKHTNPKCSIYEEEIRKHNELLIGFLNKTTPYNNNKVKQILKRDRHLKRSKRLTTSENNLLNKNYSIIKKIRQKFKQNDSKECSEEFEETVNITKGIEANDIVQSEPSQEAEDGGAPKNKSIQSNPFYSFFDDEDSTAGSVNVNANIETPDFSFENLMEWEEDAESVTNQKIMKILDETRNYINQMVSDSESD